MRYLVIIVLLVAAIPASAATVYVSQAGGSVSCGADGTQSTESVATFNGAVQVAGNIYNLCGTITTHIVAQTSGSSGSKITLQWENNASVQVCDTNGAIQLPGLSWWVVDLGGDSTAIECLNNGTGLGTSVIAVGISDGCGQGCGSGFSNMEIRNGTIGPLYQYSGTGSDGLSSDSVNVIGGTANHFHGLSMNNANQGIVRFMTGTNVSGDEIDHNTFASTIGRAIYYGTSDDSTFTVTGTLIHDNDITWGDGWYSGATDATHIECAHILNRGGTGNDTWSGLAIYNNYTHGSIRGDATGCWVFAEGVAGGAFANTHVIGTIFNNLIIFTGASTVGDGMILVGDTNHTVTVANNTMDGFSNSANICVEFDELGSGQTITFENNVCENFQTMVYEPNAAGPIQTIDYNDYYNVGSFGWSFKGGSLVNFATWKSNCSCDSHAITTIPGLNSNYTITSTGSAVYHAGVNLASLSVASLDAGAPLTFGAAGACGSGCVARPGAGAWDIGAYEFMTPTGVARGLLP